MKYDELETKTYEGTELTTVEKNVKKRRKIKVLDIVILQLILCVAISAVVLTARVITVVASGTPVDFGGVFDTAANIVNSLAIHI